jgi:hypothetical protein
MPWSRRFDEPIRPPKGKPLATLRDAAAYIMALPKSKQRSPEWQAAGEALLIAAEDRGPLMHAHVGMMLALHGAKPIPEFNPTKALEADPPSARPRVYRARRSPKGLPPVRAALLG